jgi:hypothetical protein
MAEFDLKKLGTSATSSGDAWATKNSDTYRDGKGAYQTGVKAAGYTSDIIEAAKYSGGEYYGSNWSGNVLSDPGLAKLKQTLDDAAKAGNAGREAREANFRKGLYGSAGLIALIPGGALYAAAVIVIGEGLIALGKLFAKPDPGNSEAHQADAKNAVAELWDKWRMAPPVFEADVSNAKGYAQAVRDCITLLDGTNHDQHEWRQAWVRVVDNAVNMVADKKYGVLIDAAQAGWFPVNLSEWCMTGHYCGGTLKPRCTHQGWSVLNKLDGLGRPLKWGEEYPLKKEKDGGWTYGAGRSIEQMRGASDKYAAGIGMMVAAMMPKPEWEKCIEVAVAANIFHAGNISPAPAEQGWRLRAVFADTMKAANVPMKGLLITRLNMIEREESSSSGPIAAAGAGVLAGMIFGGPIGLAVGLGALLLFGGKKE